jgi:hypothetical protein
VSTKADQAQPKRLEASGIVVALKEGQRVFERDDACLQG